MISKNKTMEGIYYAEDKVIHLEEDLELAEIAIKEKTWDLNSNSNIFIAFAVLFISSLFIFLEFFAQRQDYKISISFITNPSSIADISLILSLILFFSFIFLIMLILIDIKKINKMNDNKADIIKNKYWWTRELNKLKRG